MKIIFLSLLFCVCAFADEPKPIGYINDFAHIYSSTYVEKLDRELRKLSQNGGPEIAIVTLLSTNQKSIETQAHILFDAWSIGKKQEDNGLLLLIVPSEKAMRIELGYGLEPKLPDHICGNIIRDILAPHFKAEQYEEGTTKALEFIVQRIGAPLPEQNNADWIIPIVIFAILLIWLFRPVWGGHHYRHTRTSNWSGGSGGGFGGFGGGRGGGGGASGRW